MNRLEITLTNQVQIISFSWCAVQLQLCEIVRSIRSKRNVCCATECHHVYVWLCCSAGKPVNSLFVSPAVTPIKHVLEPYSNNPALRMYLYNTKDYSPQVTSSVLHSRLSVFFIFFFFFFSFFPFSSSSFLSFSAPSSSPLSPSPHSGF